MSEYAPTYREASKASHKVFTYSSGYCCQMREENPLVHVPGCLGTLYCAAWGLFAISLSLTKGGSWVAENITPMAATPAWLLLPVAIVIGIPCVFFPKARFVSGVLFTALSYAILAPLWILSFGVVIDAWGWIAVIIGSLFLGIGVIVLAIIALLFGGGAGAGVLVGLGLASLALRLLGKVLVTVPVIKKIDEAEDDDHEAFLGDRH